MFERELATLDSLKKDQRPAAERLLVFVEQFNKALLKWQRIIPIMFEFLSRISRQSVVQQAFKSYFHSYMEMLTPIIQQGVDSGEFKPVDVQEIAIAVGAIIEGTIILWVYDPEYINLQRHIYTGVQLLLEGIKT